MGLRRLGVWKGARVRSEEMWKGEVRGDGSARGERNVWPMPTRCSRTLSRLRWMASLLLPRPCTVSSLGRTQAAARAAAAKRAAGAGAAVGGGGGGGDDCQPQPSSASSRDDGVINRRHRRRHRRVVALPAAHDRLPPKPTLVPTWFADHRSGGLCRSWVWRGIGGEPSA